MSILHLGSELGLAVTENKHHATVMRTVLGSMALAKTGAVLTLTAQNREAAPRPKQPPSIAVATDAVALNSLFSTSLMRIKLPVPMLPHQDSDATAVAQLDAEHAASIEAVLVRAIKARKTMAYADLVAEVVKECVLFRATVRDIKSRVEDLQRRGYIQRQDPLDFMSPFVYVPEPE
jgi:hypothetical protein